MTQLKKISRKLLSELMSDLREDILSRYNNSAYWEYDIIKEFAYDHKVDEKSLIDEIEKLS